MWPFSGKRTLADSGLFRGFTDWHSHILPGVDDGVGTVDESLEILSEYERLGVSDVWLTPHVMEDIPNTPEVLGKRFAELQSAYTGGVSLHLGAENMLDNLFMERLERDELLPVGNNRDHLLVETSYFNPPADLYGMLGKLGSKGYFPVLAHPERYSYMTDADYVRLKGMGVIFQINLPSLAGLYGPEVKRRAERLLSKGYAGMLGTDVHGLKVFRHIVKSRLSKKIINLTTNKKRVLL